MTKVILSLRIVTAVHLLQGYNRKMLHVTCFGLHLILSNLFQIFLVVAIPTTIRCLLKSKLFTLVLVTMDLLWFDMI